MAGFASQAALRSHYEDLIDETENDITEKLSSAVSWFKQVLSRHIYALDSQFAQVQLTKTVNILIHDLVN